jgi:Flp pilus assembly protein TadD
MELGKALIELDHPSKAVEEFRAAGKLDPASLLARFWLGIACARARDGTRAQNLFGEVAGFIDEPWRAHGELGLIQKRRGNLKEAARLLRLSTNNADDSIWTIGSAWVGGRAPALKVTDLSGNPCQPILRRSRSRPSVHLFWRTGDEASLACLRQLQAYRALFDEDALSIVGINVDNRRFSAAAKSRVRQTVETADVTFPSWLDVNLESLARFDGRALPMTVLIDAHGIVRKRLIGSDLSKIEQSLSDLVSFAAAASQLTANEEAARYPKAERYLGMARHLARQGRLPPAIESASLSLAEPAPPVGAAALLGRLLVASGQPDQAAAVFAKAIEDNPTVPRLIAAYGYCLMHLDRPREAEKQFRCTIKLSPGCAPAHLGLGRIQAARGQIQQALREARLAAKLDPHDVGTLVFLGQVLETMQNLQEAVDAYEAAYRAKWQRAIRIQAKP